MKLHEISILDRTALEKLILSNLGALSGRIELLESGLTSEYGSVCLAVEQDRRCLLLISSVDEDDAILVRGLGQLSWIAEHRPLLNRIFGSTGMDLDQPPKIILISPSFSKALLEAVSYLNADLDLYQFRAVQADQEQAILFEKVTPIAKKAVFPSKAGPTAKIPAHGSGSVQLTDMEKRFFEGASAL